MPARSVENAAVEYDDPCWFFFTSGTTGRSKAAVLTHGQMAFVVTNHLADLMPGTTEHDASLVVAPLSHGAGVHQLVQAARGAPTILLPTERFDIDEAFRLIETHRVTQHLHRADHPEDDGRASGRRPLRPFLAALRHLCRRADVPRGPEGGAEQARQGAGAVFRPRRGHRQHHRAAAGAARSRGRPAGADRHLRLRAHGHAGLDPGRRRARARSRSRPARSA